MTVLYSLTIKIYVFAIHLASLFNSKARQWVKGRKGWQEKLKTGTEGCDHTIWVHCASLGEFEQGRPLMEMIKEKVPDSYILLTFFSPSGYELRKNWSGADYICYLPADTRRNAKLFVETVKPEKVIFIKYEFWYNYINELNLGNISLYLVSGIFRKNQHFFKWYGRFFLSMLQKFTHIFVQDDCSAQILNNVGINNVTVAGDTRFDRVMKIAGSAHQIPVIEEFAGNEKVLIAGSSWRKDEELIVKYINTSPGRMKWIFAPHEISETNILRIEGSLKTSSVRYSKFSPEKAVSRVLIIDNIGMLSSAYRYAYIAEIGGGFSKGIHNIIEAACWGVPTLFGPNHKKFREAIELIEAGGSFCFRNYNELSNIIDKLLSDTSFRSNASIAARNYVMNNTGATEKIFRSIMMNEAG
ncbi:MAG TPA: glycosyltransferase N-terminal domain-containing protein [Bacteroidales bacterium]|nr:3-deoxy-D-manno-octulosonic acid transferase [Bacteroidales bacterium]HOU95196.1 glycosyltransferase N-terminal domain-containing protein [Bacteroidales bacterium]HQG35963.1 glycosyltransferase N-terminal domain-containing protein [Bacteroidales bacterium]HQG52973.1 glycosyltransferase N-terminal domain-containing protein [Bacteroidales bacterium]HQJ20802.1 glycosyltransferase N-terminal domain-containing protein [Bacteroidales bacterium]